MLPGFKTLHSVEWSKLEWVEGRRWKMLPRSIWGFMRLPSGRQNGTETVRRLRHTMMEQEWMCRTYRTGFIWYRTPVCGQSQSAANRILLLSYVERQSLKDWIVLVGEAKAYPRSMVLKFSQSSESTEGLGDLAVLFGSCGAGNWELCENGQAGHYKGRIH